MSGRRGMGAGGGVQEEEKKKPRIVATYFRLLRYARPYWHKAVVVLALVLVAALLQVLPMQFIGVFIDELKVAEVSSSQPAPAAGAKFTRSQMPIAEPMRHIAERVHDRWLPDVNKAFVLVLVLAGGFFCLQVIQAVMSVIRGFIMADLGQRLIRDMRREVYEHMQRLSLSYFEERKTGDIMSRIVNDVNSLEQVILGPVIQFTTDIFRFAWILYFCLTWDWKLTVLGLVVAPALLGSTAVFGLFIRRAFRILREKVGDLNALVQDNISGIRVIMGFSRERHEAERFGEKNDENYRQNVKIGKMFTGFHEIIGTINVTGMILCLTYGGYQVVNGRISTGTFIVFLPYIQMLYGPITGLTRFYSMIQRAVASVERVFDIIDTEPEIQDAPDAIALDDVRGAVEFRNVSFSYANGIPVLKDISLEAEPGQMIAFVGPSGAGKTTITNLIPRFYDPTAGSVFLDGHDLRKIKLTSIRKRMAMVLQEPFLFNESVKDNIAYGRLDATDDEITAAARAANAHEFIVDLPEGYDTVIGERGVKLSGGQKQRLSIARAILADPRILILDEATSSVDTETEILIQNAIHRLVKNRTTFVIAHRLSTVQNADQIIVLDEGRVVERGTHEELLKNGTLYRRLYEMQFRLGDSAVRPEPAEDTSEPDIEPPALEAGDQRMF
ncbi:MAG: ABC transporter ATP-binding protein [Planctomycetes bacterium]|nr:ABC transporter ATP-binding protein [Planctomycetota bacterium]